MKHPVFTLLALIIVCMIVCTVGLIITIWLILPNPITFEQVILCSKIGILGGGWIGTGTWFFYYINLR